MKLTMRYSLPVIVILLIAGLLLPISQTVNAQTSCKFKTLSNANCQLITDAGSNLSNMPTFVVAYTTSLQSTGLATGNINYSLQGTGPMDFSAVDNTDYLGTLSDSVFSSNLTSKLTNGAKTTNGTLDVRMVDGYLYVAGSLVPEKPGVKFDVAQLLDALPDVMRQPLSRTMQWDTLGSLQKNGLADIPGVYQITAAAGRAVEGQATTQISLSLNLDTFFNYIVQPEHRKLFQTLSAANGQTLTNAQLDQLQRVLPLFESTFKATKLQESWLIGNKDHFYHGWTVNFSTKIDPALVSLFGIASKTAKPQPITMNMMFQVTLTKIGAPVTVKKIDKALDLTDLAIVELHSRFGGYAISPAVVPTRTPIPTETAVPSATVNSDALNMDTATQYTSPDQVVQLKLPKAFKPAPSGGLSGVYEFTYDVSADRSAVLQIAVGEPQDIYNNILQLATPASSPKDALIQLSKSTTDPSVTFTAVEPGKIGKLDAQILGVVVAGSAGTPGSQLEFLAATLPDGKIVLVVERTTTDLWSQAKPVLDAMLDSLQINSSNIPTPTITPTLHPLLLTATALETQILALTPSEMPTVTLTPSPRPANIAASAEPLGTAASSGINYQQILQSTTADGAQVLGDMNAKVTLMLFEDFSCPHCLAYAPTVTAVIQQFVKTGQARLIVEPETFVGKEFSDTAAQAALCAAKQHMHWEMRDALYVLQATKGYQSFTTDNLGNLATSLGMNAAELMSCMLSGETEPIIVKASALGDSLKITGVPSVLWSTDGKTFKFFTDANDQPIIPSVIDVANQIRLLDQKGQIASATALPTLQPTVNVTQTATPLVLSPTVSANQTVTPEGQSSNTRSSDGTVESDYLYIHSSGLMVLPHIVGWDQGSQSTEERNITEDVATPGSPPSSLPTAVIGVSFINSPALSVIHAFADSDPNRTAHSITDLDTYYTKDVLDSAWVNFTGGWSEQGRRTDGDTFIIDFKVSTGDQQFVARQISMFDHKWLKTLRLVAPESDPQLLDQLQKAIWPNYKLYVDGAGPLSWSGISDSSGDYLIRVPSDWQLNSSGRGDVRVTWGAINTDQFVLETYIQLDRLVHSADDARQWLTYAFPNATIQTVQAVTNFGAQGYTVSYSNGTSLSNVVTLLNGTKNDLFIADLEMPLKAADLLDTTDPAVPPEVATIRASFRVLGVEDDTAATPSMTATPRQTPPAATATAISPEPSATSIPASATAISPEPSATSTADDVLYKAHP